MTQKSVLITGAAKRIGKAIAIHMASNGWNVVIHYNNSANDAIELSQKLKDFGIKTCIVQADLGNEIQVRNIFKQCPSEMGVISCLVNNASIFKNDNLHNLTADMWHCHNNINLHAPLILSQDFCKQLGENKGNIINMLDYCVWNLPDKFLSYSLSKFGLWGATQMLAKQLAPNVRVNAIGLGHSLPNDRETAESFATARKLTPLQNGADPDEICRAVDFILASPSYTGQMLALDGGKHLIGAEFY